MPNRLTWTLAAWEDLYRYWQGQDKKTLKRINLLIQDALRQPLYGHRQTRASRVRILPDFGHAASMKRTGWSMPLIAMIWS